MGESTRQDLGQDANIADENTPLLAVSDVAPVPESTASSETTAVNTPRADDDRPLPVRQILLLCLARWLEPVAFFGIFPCKYSTAPVFTCSLRAQVA